MNTNKLNEDWLFDESEIPSETYEQLARDRDFKKIREGFFNDGYREGLSDSKQSSFQYGFLPGVEIGGEFGFELGRLCGILSSLCLFYSKYRENVNAEVKKELNELYDELVNISRNYQHQQTLPSFVLTEQNTKLIINNKTNREKWIEDYHRLCERVKTLCLKLGLNFPITFSSLTSLPNSQHTRNIFQQEVEKRSVANSNEQTEQHEEKSRPSM